ncbi:MAG: hypothetical protein IT453_22035 [Planctomycetes bacterium]|nr:hypothetical protein [Planctomycetota bacterium]
MAYAWIERTTSQGSERRELERGLTRLGGARAHVAIEGVSDDELQLWDDPPKLVHLGAEPHPTVNGRACTETALEPGDVIEWRGARFVFRTVARRAQLALEEETAASEHAARQRAARRQLAGLAVEHELVDTDVVRRWRESAGELDADRCAEELLRTLRKDAAPKLLEASARELADRLAPPRAKPAPRVAREAPAAQPSTARDTFWRLAFALALLTAVAAALVWARARHGVSLDAWIDRALGG